MELGHRAAVPGDNCRPAHDQLGLLKFHFHTCDTRLCAVHNTVCVHSRSTRKSTDSWNQPGRYFPSAC